MREGTTETVEKRRGGEGRGEVGLVNVFVLALIVHLTTLFVFLFVVEACISTAAYLQDPATTVFLLDNHHSLLVVLLYVIHPGHSILSMRITTFNVNGVRSWYDHYRTCRSWTFDQTLDSLDSDIICVQETKANERARVDNCILHPHKYKAYFGFPKRPKKIGHAGVAVFTRFTPTMVCDSIPDSVVDIVSDSKLSDLNILRKVDSEGRFIMCAFGRLMLIVNVYCTNDGGENQEIFVERREERRVLFETIKLLVEQKKKEYENVLVMGDFNVVYHPLDHCDYAKQYISQSLTDKDIHMFMNGEKSEPLLSEFYNDTEKPIRRWFYKWLVDSGGVDVFRHFHPNEPSRYTCWNTKVSARVSNHGTRIDTILYFGNHLVSVINDCDQLNNYQGSDHCPVWTDITVSIEEGVERGGQSRLTSFFSSSAKTDVDGTADPVKTKRPKVSLLDYVTVEKEEVLGDEMISDQTNNDDHSLEPSSSPIKAVRQQQDWTSLFHSRRKPPPLCPTHRQECILLVVKKKGPNVGRQFYMCSVPVPDRCDFFQWYRR